MWRDADEALLERLEDERVLDVLWEYHLTAAGVAPAPGVRGVPGEPGVRGVPGEPRRGIRRVHPRAAGMFAILRDKYRASDALRFALLGDVRALRPLVEPPVFQRMEPALLHHLALYFGALADAAESLPQDFATPARVRSLAAWIALASEREYLTSLAREIAGASLPRAEQEETALAIPLEVIENVGARAMGGARERSPSARSALRTLARVKDACSLADASPAATASYVARAEAVRGAAVDEALAPIDKALTELVSQGSDVVRAGRLLAPLVDVWTFTEYDEAVERFYVERTVDLAWEVYRKVDWVALRTFLAPFHPLVDSLAGRIEQDPSKIAYASQAAQFLVFRSEANRDAPDSRSICEWALRVCPPHRNGRLVMAAYLCSDANALIDKSWTPKAPPEATLVAAKKLLDRAEKISPMSPRVAALKKRLNEVGIRNSGNR